MLRRIRQGFANWQLRYKLEHRRRLLASVNATLLEAIKILCIGADGKHVYLSTYCLHSLHEACPEFCKTCKEECLCPCHPWNAGAQK